MPLAAVMENLDDVAPDIAALYTEKNGKFELTGIQGIKTPADVQRVQQALDHERANHGATKEKLTAWGELDPKEVMPKLDRIPELEAAAEGKIDDVAIEEIVQRRLDGTIKSQTAPLERQITTLKTENETLATENTSFKQKEIRRTIKDNVTGALIKAKVIDHARDDALLLADRIFEVREDDQKVVTKEGVGVTPGLGPEDWMAEITSTNSRPHWFGLTTGGGANPGDGGGAGGGSNPFLKENWNMTTQGQIIREKGIEAADRLAKAAGHKGAAGAHKRDAK